MISQLWWKYEFHVFKQMKLDLKVEDMKAKTENIKKYNSYGDMCNSNGSILVWIPFLK